MKIHFPLNDIRAESTLQQYRDNLIKMWEDEPIIRFYGYSAKQMFYYALCYNPVYLVGEKYGDTMKYFIMGEIIKGEYVGTTIYIHKDFRGQSRQIMAQALNESAKILKVKGINKTYSYTRRGVRLFERLFRDMGAKHVKGEDRQEGDYLIQKYSMNFGEDLKDVYDKIASKGFDA